MSSLQQLLERRMRISSNNMDYIFNKPQPKSDPVEQHKPEPKPEPKPEQIPEPVQVIQEPLPVPPRKKNERNAGRRKINKDIIAQKKEKIIERLAKGKDEDIDTVKEIKESCNKEEIQKEIELNKKKLKLLNDAFILAHQD